METTCRLFGQQRGTKGAQKGKMEPDCESEHGFASTSGHSEGTWSRLASFLKHLEVTWSPLGVHLDSRMHLEFSRRVPRACRRTKSSQNVRVSTILKGPVSPLGVHLEALGAHLEHTWCPLGLQDAPGVQQKGSKGVQRAKIEPECESELDFEAPVIYFRFALRPTHCID